MTWTYPGHMVMGGLQGMPGNGVFLPEPLVYSSKERVDLGEGHLAVCPMDGFPCSFLSSIVSEIILPRAADSIFTCFFLPCLMGGSVMEKEE